MKVSVVIPYYQRTPGLLLKAVRSAVAQDYLCDMIILVIDDGSPISARDELASINTNAKRKIQIIEQSNSGVGKARNTALDNIPNDTDLVAFLDSDDEWSTDHIRIAANAFLLGADFYFCDLIRHDWETTAFSRCATFNPTSHKIIDDNDQLYEFIGNAFEQVIRNNMIGTSVVAYRYDKFKSIRFPTDLLNSGEDILFWLEIIHNAPSIFFSSKVGCKYDQGINICYGARWGTTKGLNVAYNDILMSMRIIEKFNPTPELTHHIEHQVSVLSRNIAEQSAHMVLRGKLHALMWVLKTASISFSVISTFLHSIFNSVARIINPAKF